MIRTRAQKAGLAVALFFAFKIALGGAILIASAHWMTVASFAVFSQLLVLIAYLASIGTAGVQNGLVRQIAAANDDKAAIGREVRAALLIWLVVAFLVLVGCLIVRGWIAILLTGRQDVAWAVPWLALLAIWSGLGQLLCSVLTGSGRAGSALSAQAIGLFAGTVPALFLLHQSRPEDAAIALIAGQGLTTLLAASRTRNILLRASREAGSVRTEIRRLLGFSGAFLATASIMPLTLTALRSYYRSRFGLEALGFWLAANRISDVNTQLLGLYMVQAFLPAMAAAPPVRRRTLAFRTAALAIGVMAIPLIVFLIAPALFVETFLSAKFLPGTVFFIAYFLGDMLRGAASTASFAALAYARLTLYVGMEVAAAFLMSAFVILLGAAGTITAPAIAYPACYGLLLIAASLFLLWRKTSPASRT